MNLLPLPGSRGILFIGFGAHLLRGPALFMVKTLAYSGYSLVPGGTSVAA